MTTTVREKPSYSIKMPTNLSPRIQWLRDYYFQGVKRTWNNEYTSWTTGTPWDFQYNELTFYIVPETYTFLQTFRSSFKQVAHPVDLHPDFWKWSLPERRAWFNREVMVHYLPKEILPFDLIAGGRFNIQTSACLTKKETRQRDKLVYGPAGSRSAMLWFHNHGYGNVGATSGHLIPDYGRIIREGWKAVHAELSSTILELSPKERASKKGAQLRAMLTAVNMPFALAAEYSKVCENLAQSETNGQRQRELLMIAHNLSRVPWEPANNFWEAVQALWLTHMLVLADENYPGPGDSFGRLDQYLYPLWEKSIAEGMDAEFGKEILKCFWLHCNTAYDGMIRTGGNQGITAGFGQLFTISGMGAGGKDKSNDLTYILLDVIDEMSPILEPKPNVRLHRGSPERLLDRVVNMIASSQGSPFLLNFDERSMAGMMLQAKKSGVEHLIHKDNVFDYAPVGCLENTMVGNDRSGTVDANLNLLKAVELTLTSGYDLLPFIDPLTGKADPPTRWGADTGDSTRFETWDQFWQAYAIQTRHIIQRITDLYEQSESIRARYAPTPYLSCLVKGCAQQGKDVTEGGAELGYVTIEVVTYATTVDSLLAVKYLVFDQKACTMAELIQALKDNWVGHEVLQARALHKAPKYGRDDDAADAMAYQVMELWSGETWKYQTKSTGRQFRPGMLSWNYWVADSFILPASPDGRPRGKFLSNALCPSNGADINGPTANVNSVGKALGGKAMDGRGDWEEYLNLLPNGGSHTMTFNPSILRDAEHRQKFKAFLKGYIENGGSALQVNLINTDMLRDAQDNPET
ncbi:MAG TPA: pyruvate formate lyase family protein, partial [Anaerolineales bacterium]|nr:pyruvate formate lyase family protein [Anaerolineales bacterium]